MKYRCSDHVLEYARTVRLAATPSTHSFWWGARSLQGSAGSRKPQKLETEYTVKGLEGVQCDQEKMQSHHGLQ